MPTSPDSPSIAKISFPSSVRLSAQHVDTNNIEGRSHWLDWIRWLTRLRRAHLPRTPGHWVDQKSRETGQSSQLLGKIDRSHYCHCRRFDSSVVGIRCRGE